VEEGGGRKSREVRVKRWGQGAKKEEETEEGLGVGAGKEGGGRVTDKDREGSRMRRGMIGIRKYRQ
jgi:hypothetical protein